ncbi:MULTISPECIES: helix-turn-helix transcriptional regulator [Nocardioides]|uniref:Helix-turn-helix transcriptional regulator n=1 Tax=Nocardioides vastitatis TaxID=2568655 RepID=A0ABW0ZLY0_9ACTN|nr:helix-turn-helix domain-containing protein [Nocardioides sp.]THJ05782.1 helix-turn-helix domain-containing protein [Nocardioides sp.]
MNGDKNGREQPGLWDEEIPSTDRPDGARRHQSRATKAAARTKSQGQPQPPTTTPPTAQAIHPELDIQDLWDAARVAAYLGVPRQTLYAWRHTGNGPKGFRVGKHLRWHPHTVVEWTLALERDQ